MISWIWQTAAFGAIAALCAFGTFWINGEVDRRIPCDSSILKENEVCLDTVLNDWKGDVIWIDARDQKHVNETIEGALSISPGQFDDDIAREGKKLFFAGQEGKKAVIFCASEHCGSSKKIVEVIKKMELHDDIHFLHGGWDAIKAEKEKLTIEER